MPRKPVGPSEGITPKLVQIIERDVRQMLYGFGDVEEPREDTVAALTEVVIEYMVQMTRAAGDVGFKPGKLTPEDLVFLVRKDARKFARVRELLELDRVINMAKKKLGDEETT